MLLDADEEVPKTLAERLQKIVDKYKAINYVEIPRKNIIFGKWMQNSGWWPDYQVRLFKKGAVFWQEKIHSKPELSGEGIKLDPNEDLAIVHHNYQSLEQLIERMNRYTTVEAEQIHKEGYKFDWKDLIKAPSNEFLSRFFANQGYKDGLHGLTLSLLQAFSFLVVYLKLWQLDSFKDKQITLSEIEQESDKTFSALNYWFKGGNSSKNIFKTFLTKLKG
jgi:(heptosyl)LPS beta-1,4-glucosyltransferase